MSHTESESKYKILQIGFIIIILLAAASYFFLTSTTSKKYVEYTTIDGRYTVYSCRYRYCYLFELMPFHETEFDSGKAYLYDNEIKKVIGSGHVDMVSLGHISWFENEIYFKGEGSRWTLPQEVEF